jgi:hypothetical protein
LGVIVPTEVVLGWIWGWGEDENQPIQSIFFNAISSIRLIKTSINFLLIHTIISQ